MSEFVQYVAGVGFPIAVAGFVLIRLEPAVRSLAETLAKLTGVIEKCQK